MCGKNLLNSSARSTNSGARYGFAMTQVATIAMPDTTPAIAPGRICGLNFAKKDPPFAAASVAGACSPTPGASQPPKATASVVRTAG